MSAVRNEEQLYPDFSPELKEIKENGISEQLLSKIIEKHSKNSLYNKALYKRYMGLDGAVPIFNREPRFKMKTAEGNSVTQINNKINNDFLGEIVDFKTGYFAGRPFSYSYSHTEESVEDTGGKAGVSEASKALSDFVVRNNMYDVDMEITKHAAIYGYAGRLLYHDPEGNERVMMVPGYEVIVLSSTTIMEPEYAIWYRETEDLSGNKYYIVEFYDETTIKTYEGQKSSLAHKEDFANLYGYCPLQGVPNNDEMIGDAEKVLAEIDAYDRVVSDSSNQIEGQVNSKEIYENVNITQEEIALANYTGALSFYNGTGNGRIYNLEKNINDAFVEHQLTRLENNIYRFSKTPNMNDQAFSQSTGVALRFKLTGLETKCGMFQAKMQTAGVYMFKLLGASFDKKRIAFDSLQCYIGFSRNFPLDTLSNAQAAQALIGAGLPERVAWDIAVPEIDDIDYVMQVKEEEKSMIPSLDDFVREDFGYEEEVEDEESGMKLPRNEKKSAVNA